MTELDLQDLGIWRIPLSPSETDPRAGVNAWAIEDVNRGITLFDCGCGTPESLTALTNGLARLGATPRDVRRIILSHAHAEHAGGARRVVERAAPGVEVFASVPERRRLRGTLDLVHELWDGTRFEFRHFVARAMHMPGHATGLTCLFAETAGVFFSSDHLLHDVTPIPVVGLRTDGWESPFDIRAYGASLARLLGLEVRVVLPGRGPPFAGHRRVVREVVASLGLGVSAREQRLGGTRHEHSEVEALRRLA